MQPGPEETPEIRRELNDVVARLLSPLCLVLSALYASYAGIQLFVFSEPRVAPLATTWAMTSALFLTGGLALRWGPPPPKWAHVGLSLTAALVLANSLRLIHHGGPPFSTVLILVMLGYATLALSRAWTLGLVVTTILGWVLVARLGPAGPAWQAMGVMLVSAAAIALLTQSLRLTAMRRLVGLRFLERRRERQRHEEEEQRLRVDLINTAAHELATPLTPLTIQLYTLKQGDNLTASQRRSVELLEKNLRRLNLVVQNIQEFARLSDDTAVNRVPCDISQVLRAIVESYGSVARANEQQLEERIAADLRADADPHRLRLALTQLLDNATKFVPAGGRIQVRAHREGPWILIEVEDDGPGMTQEALRRVFEPLASQRSDAHTGAHLGLHLARRIVAAHEGQLRIASEAGHGTRVHVRIPAPQTN